MTEQDYKDEIHAIVEKFLEAPHTLSLSEDLPFGYDYSGYTEEERTKRKIELKNRAEKNMYNSRAKYLIDELWRLKQQYELSNVDVMQNAVNTIYKKDSMSVDSVTFEVAKYKHEPIPFINLDDTI